MIDKLSNIKMVNSQNKRVTEETKGNEVKVNTSKSVPNVSDKSSDGVKISDNLSVKDMSADAPIDTLKVSAIKEAIAKGDYPVDLDRVADALLQAYSDIK